MTISEIIKQRFQLLSNLTDTMTAAQGYLEREALAEFISVLERAKGEALEIMRVDAITVLDSRSIPDKGPSRVCAN
jgi:hypothetical protein